MIGDEELVEKLNTLTDNVEAVVERFMDARDDLAALVDAGNPDRRARQLARDRLLDRAIDIESAATDLEQLLRLARDGQP
ncbi:MAG: hypothetical protein WEB00_12350 [Dehalococcoidia bacterium]